MSEAGLRKHTNTDQYCQTIRSTIISLPNIINKNAISYYTFLIYAISSQAEFKAVIQAFVSRPCSLSNLYRYSP